jgi:SOS-response transcriptional repressor LexA
MAELYTKRQGEYLAFIHLYTKLHKQPPAEADIQAYFRVSAPTVHQMIVGLENRGLIQKTPYQARSIRLLISPQSLPDLDGDGTALPVPPGSFEGAYPHIAAWIAEDGWIELGYEPNTDTYARAIDNGGVVWSGGHRHATVDENLRAMDSGIQDYMDE